MATYAIGDVQGCFRELQSLIQLIKFAPSKDRLWFCGDIVNRGPQSLEVLQWIYQHRESIVLTLGNHDLYLLALFYGIRKPYPEDTLHPILQASNAKLLCEWLLQQKIIDYQPPYLLVHAGIPPIWDLQQTLIFANQLEHELQNHPEATLKKLFQKDHNELKTIADYFTRMRFCDEQGNLDLTAKALTPSAPQFKPWFEWPNPINDDVIILFGHWAALMGKTNQNNRIGLDTGCVWGNQLSALRLEDRCWFQVPFNTSPSS